MIYNLIHYIYVGKKCYVAKNVCAHLKNAAKSVKEFADAEQTVRNPIKPKC